MTTVTVRQFFARLLPRFCSPVAFFKDTLYDSLRWILFHWGLRDTVCKFAMGTSTKKRFSVLNPLFSYVAHVVVPKPKVR